MARFTRIYWGTVGVLALLGLLWRVGYIYWRDLLPVRVAVDCGEEHVQRGENVTMDRRECLWRAYQEGRTARLVEHDSKVFGPRVTTLTVAGPGRLRIVRETQNEHGQRISGRDTCEEMQLVPDPPRASFFSLRGCTSKYGRDAVGYLGEFDPVRGG